MRRLAATGAVVATLIAGHALGALLPADKVASASFVSEGAPGETVALPYADVRLAGMAIATDLTGPAPSKPDGRYLVLDLEVTARGEPLRGAPPYVRDRDQRRYAVSPACAGSLTLATGIPSRVRLCVDLPQSALAGATLVLGRGSQDIEGNRRDAVAEFDLGLSPAGATTLWDGARPLSAFAAGAIPPRDWLGR